MKVAAALSAPVVSFMNAGIKPSTRIRLNVGGRRFETTAMTLTETHGTETYFASLMRHTPLEELTSEIFIDRDGDAFAPLLNYMRTGSLSIPLSTNEAAVRAEADFYCISLPTSDAEGVRRGCIRCDGLYLSFGGPGGAAGQREGAIGGLDEDGSGGEARAYLIFHQDGRALLGRREADGQWSALHCRYRCLPGRQLLVHKGEPAAAAAAAATTDLDGASVQRPATVSEDEDGPEATSQLQDEGEEMGPLELAAVVLDGDFIRVMACGRVGRLENPFHFFASVAPRPGTAFISQVGRAFTCGW